MEIVIMNYSDAEAVGSCILSSPICTFEVKFYDNIIVRVKPTNLLPLAIRLWLREFGKGFGMAKDLK